MENIPFWVDMGRALDGDSLCALCGDSREGHLNGYVFCDKHIDGFLAYKGKDVLTDEEVDHYILLHPDHSSHPRYDPNMVEAVGGSGKWHRVDMCRVCPKCETALKVDGDYLCLDCRFGE